MARGTYRRGLNRDRGTGGWRPTARRLGGSANRLRREIKHNREQGREKGEGRGGSLPQGVPQGPLGGGEGATTARVNGGGTGTAWRTAGERGQRKSRRQRRNWSVSRVADVEAALTVAEGTAGLRRRRGNRLGTAADNGGSSLACAQRGGVEMRLCRCTNEGGGE
jgi:hypothetical protein